jgi:uncharacterized protein
VQASIFNLYVDEFPSAGQSLVYNTLTGAFLELDADGRRFLEGLAAGKSDAADVDPEWLGDNAGFVVDKADDDERAFTDWYEAQRSHTDTLSCIVSITFACNMDCTYCCQADVLDGRGMKADSAEATATWLAGRAREIGAKRIDLCFLGGEPLLYPARIETIVARVRELAPGVQVVFSLITNGTLMTRELVERWVPLGLYAAQVTLDGDETTHSHTRRSKKKGEDSFATIFANVIAAAPFIRLIINGNYQDDTVHGFPGLILKLREAGLPASARLEFSPALTALGAPEGGGAGGCTISSSRPEMMIALKDQIRNAGFSTADGMNLGPCSFHKRHAYAIDPDGHIYKCPGFLGKVEWAIGSVTDGLTERYDQLVELRPHVKNCGGCAHRPDCAGGCVAAEFISKGTTEGVNCEGDYFHRFGDDLLKRKYAEVDPSINVPPMDVSFAAPTQGRRSPMLRVMAA